MGRTQRDAGPSGSASGTVCSSAISYPLTCLRSARWPGVKDQPGVPGKPGFRDAVYSSHALGDRVSETDGAGFRDIYSDPANQKSLKTYDAKRKLWAVTETWWFQIEPGWVVVGDSGMLEEMGDEEFAQRKADREQQQKAALQQVMAGQATFAPPPRPMKRSSRAARRSRSSSTSRRATRRRSSTRWT